MIASLKENVLPLLVYLLVIGACAVAMFRRPQFGVWVFCVLVMFPQLWYPIHGMPLGSMSLTLLFAATLVGSFVQPVPQAQPAPSLWLVWLLALYSYVSLWVVSQRYGLPMPIGSDNPVFRQWQNFATMLLLYWMAFRTMRDEADLKTLALIFVVVLLLTSWREYRNFYGSASFSYERRAAGTFPMMGMAANHFGAFISNVAALCIGLAAVDRHKLRRRLYLLTFLCALYPLFFSYSRGAYAALLAAVAVVGVVRYRIVLVFLAVLAVSWQSVLPDTVVERMTMTESADGEVEESAAMRLVVWQLAQDLFADHPLVGIGFNGFYFATEGLPLRNAHNYYLTVAAEQGLVGLLLLAVLLMRALYSGWRLYRQGHSELLRAVGLGFVAYTVSMVVTNVFGDRFSQFAMGSYFWLLFGAVERARLLAKPEAQTADPRQPPPAGSGTPLAAGHPVTG